MTDLRDEVADALERLSQLQVVHATGAGSAGTALKERQERVRFLGQVAAAWGEVADDAFPPTGAGFASTAVVEDLDDGARESFTLMAGPLLDFDAGQVSLASPIGQALLGAKVGDVVNVRTPQRLRRLRVVAIVTLRDRLAEDHPPPAA